MRPTASILHLDLDAFFASVEQRDKPSLRGKSVIVGGLGPRGVVSTASYEARAFGVGSAMSMSEARRRAPRSAFLAGRFDAYRASSRVVMALLAELSPLVEPLSLDEAFVDLAAGGIDCADPSRVADLATRLRAELTRRTDGLTASVGVGTSKFMAKLASEAAKPDGLAIIEPGHELATITPMRVRAIPGVGPATVAHLSRLGIATIADVQKVSEKELIRELGQAAGHALHELAFARDDRPVIAHRETKSISVEDTFPVDLTDPSELRQHIDRDARLITDRLRRARLFARTVTLKIKLADFTTYTRSRTLTGSTDDPHRVAIVARALLDGLETTGGVRLVGVGLANFTQAAQEELFFIDDTSTPMLEEIQVPSQTLPRRDPSSWLAGMDVTHTQLGRGWVWGSGLGLVTIRFESRFAGGGPVRTFCSDDPHLCRADPEPLSATEAGSSNTSGGNLPTAP